MAENNIESLQDILAMMNPEVHMNLKTAVELGRWPDGRKLTAEQLEYCMQAIIAYEQECLPENQRVGFIDRTGLKTTECDDPSASNHGPDQVMPVNLLKH